MLSKNYIASCVRSSQCRGVGEWVSSSLTHSNLRMCQKATGKNASINLGDKHINFDGKRELSHASSVCKHMQKVKNTKKYHSMVLDDLISTANQLPAQQNEMKRLTKIAVKHVKERLTPFLQLADHTSASNSKSKPYSAIPGPRGIPLLGSALEYTFLGRFSPKEYHKALRHRHDRYGTIFRERLLQQEFVYVSDPKDIRLLAQNEGSAPSRPHLDAIVESRKQENLPVGITAMQGEEWLRNRNAINPAISAPNVVKKYRFAQKEIAQDLVAHIRIARDSNTGEVAEFDQTLNRWALESIAVALLDTRLGLLTPGSSNRNPAAEQLRKCMDVFFDYGARLTFGMPLWKLWNTKDWKIFRKAQKDEFKYAGYFVEKRLKEMGKKSCPVKSATTKTSGCPFHKKKDDDRSFSCLLDHVINNSELCKEEAITICLELLAGGIDTTATAAVFTIHHLATNKCHQDHLRGLLKEDKAENTDLEVYNRDRSEFSKYLKACIWESMRLNPLTYANMRTTEKDLVLSGYSVPAGTTVRYDSHLMNLEDEQYFPEPKKFIPDRWLDRNSPYRCKEQFTFTPFGHGARQCPGRRVAEQELDLLFRELLRNFDIGYKYEKMGTKVRLFNRADKAAKFDFTPLN